MILSLTSQTSHQNNYMYVTNITVTVPGSTDHTGHATDRSELVQDLTTAFVLIRNGPRFIEFLVLGPVMVRGSLGALSHPF